MRLCLYLDKYEKNEEVQEYFGHMLEVMKHQKVFFDLGSILIKPVQRILKYPLLLNQLYKSTETEHADKQHLVAAINMMTEVAGIINELKHRKDLVLKYRKDTDSKLSDKISRITVHSAKKKFYRVTQKMVGVQKIDENFLREEKKFKDISLAVRLLVHGLSTYLEQLQDSVACAESVANDMSDYYAEKSTLPEVEQFCEVHNQIATYLFQTFRAEVDVEVMSPLNRLLLMFQGPMKVIKKRHDKELDFNKISSRVGNPRDSEQLKSMNEELQQARRTYEALNAQLLDELPQLYVLTLDVLRECVARLVHSQKVFFDKALQLVEQLLSLPFVLCASDANIVEDFSAAHVSIVESLSNLSFLPKTFSPQPDEKKPSKGRKSVDVKGPPLFLYLNHECSIICVSQDPDSGAQSDSQRVVITQSYPAQQLFTVVSDFLGQQQMDVSAPGGTVVGVIKEGDPMGNKDRWFVDTGAAKGFIPKKFLASLKEEAGPVDDVISPLTPDFIGVGDTSFDMSTSAFEACNASLDSSLSSPLYDGATAAPHSPCSPTGAAPPSEKSEMVYSEESAQDFDAEPDNNAEAEYYRAVYAFEARCPIEVTLRDGMLVKVVESHDLDGNTEWWLVETEDGCQGYAPANYLYKA
ncbi:Dynamin-binding protein [Lamellibrachia satsuma]|nr:Dynamin-binding protein [Lamellibrachia satsuma]